LGTFVTGVVALLVVLAAATVLGLVWQRRTGRVRATAADAAERVSRDEIAADLGERATLLQFSSAFCQPCRATRRILADVAEVTPGVAHVEVDAEAHLDLVRRLGVMKTPTTLVLDADGVVRRRAAGQPRKDEVLAALADVVA
jgi:thiol-disulfide isomerase/thioredoxin